MDEGEAAAAIDDMERDRAEAEAAEQRAREEKARQKKEERRKAREARKARREKKASKAEEAPEAEQAVAEAQEAAAAIAETSAEPAGETTLAGDIPLDEALPLLAASGVASMEAEPLRLFDGSENEQRSFPWARWLGINLVLAMLLGGAVYGAKKGKLAHWLKRARLPRRGTRRIAPELNVSATHNLAHGQAIHLIEGDDFRLVVGSWPGGMARLATLPAGGAEVAVEDPFDTAEETAAAAAIPEGAGMTADDEELPAAASAPIDEVALAQDGVELKVDIGTYDSWFDEESKADEDGPVTVDDDELPTVKELAFPEVLRQAAAGTLAAAPATHGPQAVGLFRAGADDGAAIPADPNHESLAEQVLARVREMRASR